MGKLNTLFNQVVTQNLVDVKKYQAEYLEVSKQIQKTATELIDGTDLYSVLEPEFKKLWCNARDVDIEASKEAMCNWKIDICQTEIGNQIYTILRSESMQKARELYRLIHLKASDETVDRETETLVTDIYADRLKKFILTELDITDPKGYPFEFAFDANAHKCRIQLASLPNLW